MIEEGTFLEKWSTLLCLIKTNERCRTLSIVSMFFTGTHSPQCGWVNKTTRRWLITFKLIATSFSVQQISIRHIQGLQNKLGQYRNFETFGPKLFYTWLALSPQTTAPGWCNFRRLPLRSTITVPLSETQELGSCRIFSNNVETKTCYPCKGDQWYYSRTVRQWLPWFIWTSVEICARAYGCQTSSVYQRWATFLLRQVVPFTMLPPPSTIFW